MSTDNPYIAPAATIADPRVEVPEEILVKIGRAWKAALFSAGVTLLFTLIAMSGTRIPGFSGWEQLLDVALILGLAFGIYKKSRVCAVLILCYFILSKILLMKQTGGASSIPMAVVFIYFYWQGIVGTFGYHRFLKESR